MAKGRKNKTLIYALIGVLVLGFLYLYFHGRKEGFEIGIKNDSESTNNKLVYYAKALDPAPSDKNIEIPQEHINGRKIKNFTLEYKALNENFIKVATCPGEVSTQAQGSFDVNTSTKFEVTLKSSDKIRLRNAFYKQAGQTTSGSGSNKTTVNNLYRDCPPSRDNASSVSRLDQPAKDPHTNDAVFPQGSNIIVPYTINNDTLIFKNVLDANQYPGGVAKGNIPNTDMNRINVNANPNVRITIELE